MTTEMGEQKEYAGKGVAGTGLGLGIAGTALGLLAGGNGNGILGGLFGGKSQDYVTKEEFDLNTKIMEKDGEIALLKADKYTDSKILETYSILNQKISDLNDKVDNNRDRGDDRLYKAVEKVDNKIDFNKNVQDQVNTQQGIWNATNTATIACIQGQVNQLMGLTKLGIPNSSLCPGYGSVSVYPSTAVAVLSA